MNLDTLILSSLLETGSAVISQIGTFSVKYYSARLVKEEQISFIPPKYDIAFSHEVNNEHTFENFISEKEGISIDETKSIISDFVQQILASFEKNEDFALQNIGILHSDWTFESQIPADLFPETYGLASFSMDKLPDAEKKNAKERPAKIAKTAVKTLFIASPILFGALLIPNILQISQNEDFASAFRNTTTTVDYATPEMPRPHDFKTSEVIEQEPTIVAQVSKTPKVENQKAKTQRKNKAEKPLKAKKEKSKVTAKTTKKVKTPQKTKVSNDAKYFIIVGTFSVKSNAEKLSKKLQSKDFNSGVISENNKNRVYVSAFANADEAQQCLKTLHENPEYDNAWVYVKQS